MVLRQRLKMPENGDITKKMAVALRYQSEQDRAPRIVAKGRGHVAGRILELAKEHGVAIYEDPDLVQVLSKIELNKHIPEELYQAVIEVLIYVYRVNGKIEEISKILGPG